MADARTDPVRRRGLSIPEQAAAADRAAWVAIVAAAVFYAGLAAVVVWVVTTVGDVPPAFPAPPPIPQAAE